MHGLCGDIIQYAQYTAWKATAISIPIKVFVERVFFRNRRCSVAAVVNRPNAFEMRMRVRREVE